MVDPAKDRYQAIIHVLKLYDRTVNESETCPSSCNKGGNHSYKKVMINFKLIILTVLKVSEQDQEIPQLHTVDPTNGIVGKGNRHKEDN